jgi:lipopolysaccharide transport system permease protein
MVGAPMSTQEVPVRIIRPAPRWPLPKLREAWERRELLWFLTVRDVKVRYAQTLLGATWTLLQPLILMLVFTIAFQKIANVDTGSVPYPVFALAGLIFWTYFSRSVTQGADSLVSNTQLVTKTSSPRLLLTLSSISGGLLDFALGLGFFFIFAAFYGELPGWELVFLPLIVLFGIAVALGPVLLFASLNAQYRDVRFIIPILIQTWLFLSPIAYPMDKLGEPWATLSALNPVVGVVDGFRWSLLSTPPPGAWEVAACVGVTAILLAVAALYFGRTERLIADRI